MKYLVIIYGNKDLWESFPPESWGPAIEAQNAFNDRYIATGKLLSAFGLGVETTAKTVRRRNGLPAVTEGPYVEAKEFVSSVYLLEVDSEARALEIAADIPFAAERAVELWPVLHGSGMEMRPTK